MKITIRSAQNKQRGRRFDMPSVNDFFFFQTRLRKIGWDNKKPVLELTSHKSEEILLSYNWKTKNKNFFKSYFTLTDYGACSVLYPYLDLEYKPTSNATDRQYDGFTIYKQVSFNHY